MDQDQEALLALGRELLAAGYRFTTVTPATHARVNTRPGNSVATSLADVFGWSRPFRRDAFRGAAALLETAGALEPAGDLVRSAVRFSSLGDQLYLHSAWPTEAPDSVFFGPDTYRFARAIRAAMAGFAWGEAVRIVDIGCGSGAGGLFAASLAPATTRADIVLADVNAKALRFARVNAALNGIDGVQTVESDVFRGVSGPADIILSNPPYLVDPAGRAYRHGGGALGFDLSLRIVEESLHRLAPGGRLVLYTGAPMVAGSDPFRAALLPRLAACGHPFTYEELDPDVFGEELDTPPYRTADRIAVVSVVVSAPQSQEPTP
jgi:SAM-dependent methyltransferase